MIYKQLKLRVVKKWFKWMFESNRPKHFLYAIPCALLLTVLFVAGLATGMEFKDKAYGGEWDWLDFIATIAGGMVGQTLQILIIYYFIM